MLHINITPAEPAIVATGRAWLAQAARRRLAADFAAHAEAMAANPDAYCPMCDGDLDDGRFCHACAEPV